jgi:hypothetical protein
MDILFGTYRCPDREPEHLGLNEPTPRTYLGHMVNPLLPNAVKRPPDVTTSCRLVGSQADKLAACRYENDSAA